jgi:hypothetical protein
MPKVVGVILDEGQSVPQPVHAFMVAGNTWEETIALVMNASRPPTAVIETSVGKLYVFDGPNASHRIKNAVGTQIMRQENKNLPDDVVTQYGRCFLLDTAMSTTAKRDGKKEVHKGPSKAITTAFAAYAEVTGKDPLVAKKKRAGPARVMKAVDFFTHEFHSKDKKEWEEKAMEEWNAKGTVGQLAWFDTHVTNNEAVKDKKVEPFKAFFNAFIKEKRLPFAERGKLARSKFLEISDEEKARYEKLVEADKQRFELENRIYMEKNPKPPQKLKKAFHFYQRDAGKIDPVVPWKSLDDEGKAPFYAMEKEDNVRFQKEWKEYQAKCEDLGIDYTKVMNDRIRKHLQPKPPLVDEPNLKRRKATETDGSKSVKRKKKERVDGNDADGSQPKPKRKKERVDGNAADGSEPKPKRKKTVKAAVEVCA